MMPTCTYNLNGMISMTRYKRNTDQFYNGRISVPYVNYLVCQYRNNQFLILMDGTWF